MMRLTPMAKNILIANIVIFAIQAILSLPLEKIFGLRVVFAEDFAAYQFATYMWIHGGFGHLLSNMFAVFIFGPMLEQVWGGKRFLTFYLICGIGAGVLYGIANYVENYSLKQDTEAYLEDPNPDRFSLFVVEHKSPYFNVGTLAEFSDSYYDNPTSIEYRQESIAIVKQMFNTTTNIPMVGASGAIFGILMAFGMMFPNTELFLLFPPIPVKAKYLVMFYAAYEVYSEFSRTPGDNIAHLAHLGGMLIAFLLLNYWKKDTGRFY
ncbi:MAG: membrane associated rhomboid family serine protease [Marinoscillum sp.]|jgi:membrane associated rhomboid family serine protease